MGAIVTPFVIIPIVFPVRTCGIFLPKIHQIHGCSRDRRHAQYPCIAFFEYLSFVSVRRLRTRNNCYLMAVTKTAISGAISPAYPKSPISRRTNRVRYHVIKASCISIYCSKVFIHRRTIYRTRQSIRTAAISSSSSS